MRQIFAGPLIFGTAITAVLAIPPTATYAGAGDVPGPCAAATIVHTQQELDQALARNDIAEICIVPRQQDYLKNPVLGRLLGSSHFTVPEPRYPIVVKAFGEAELDVSGGNVYTYDNVTITKATGGGILAHGKTRVKQVLGAGVWAYDDVSVDALVDGMVIASNNAKINSVTDGHVNATDNVVINEIAGGRIYLWDKTTVGQVSGGVLDAFGTAAIETVTGGKVEVNGEVTINKVTGGRVIAGYKSKVKGVTGGRVVAWGDSTITLGAGPASIREYQGYLGDQLMITGRKVVVTQDEAAKPVPQIFVEWQEDIAIPITVKIDNADGKRIFGRPDPRPARKPLPQPAAPVSAGQPVVTATPSVAQPTAP